MRRTYVVLLFVIILYTGCQSDNAAPTGLLIGKWIEVSARKDTIEFKPELSFLELRSERDTSRLASYPNGLWTYEIGGDSIQVHYSLSSFRDDARYSFQLNPNTNTFTVGNFYKPATGQTTLQFERLK